MNYSFIHVLLTIKFILPGLTLTDTVSSLEAPWSSVTFKRNTYLPSTMFVT